MARPQIKEHFGKVKKKKAKEDIKVVHVQSIGHNSEVIPGLVSCVDEFLSLDEQKKAIAKAQRDIRNKVKSEYNVLSSVFAHEIRLRKLDKDVRVQFESSHADLKVALGYQHELDLKHDTIARTEEEYVDPSNRVPVDVIQREG